MKLLIAGLSALALNWLGAGAAHAQLADPEANLVEEVVVKARLPGPAWWRVSDADSVVYIIGGPEGSLPPGMTWNSSVLERRLEGAHTFVGGASIRVGLSGVPALLRLRGQLKSKTPLESTLPPELRDRFVAARTRLGQPASRYAGSTPLLAGDQLYDDSREAGKWRSIQKDIEAAAKRRKLKLTSTAHVDGTPFFRTVATSLTPQVHNGCLEAALDDVEAPGRARRAAQGWADGDLRAALDHPRGFQACLLLMAGGEQIWKRVTRNQTQDVIAALEKPGHGVAVITLRRLMAEDGVLQQLRAAGYQVTGPADPRT